VGEESCICTLRTENRIGSMLGCVSLMHIESDCKRTISEDNIVINPIGDTNDCVSKERVEN
jgi:hypothetical protein